MQLHGKGSCLLCGRLGLLFWMWQTSWLQQIHFTMSWPLLDFSASGTPWLVQSNFRLNWSHSILFGFLFCQLVYRQFGLLHPTPKVKYIPHVICLSKVLQFRSCKNANSSFSSIRGMCFVSAWTSEWEGCPKLYAQQFGQWTHVQPASWHIASPCKTKQDEPLGNPFGSMESFNGAQFRMWNTVFVWCWLERPHQAMLYQTGYPCKPQG